MGLADDGGLLVPETIPDVSASLEAWREMDFVSLAKAVLQLFATDIPPEDLDGLIEDAYATFDVPEVVRVVDAGPVQVLELFHGPTLAFKDVALQLLGHLFDYVLARRNQTLNIVGATSGDTGSAAISGVRGRENIQIFILYPLGRVSDLQELQMTTVTDDNVHCLAIEGSFDDCQALVKEVFGDLSFKRQYALGAVNSMNWARVLAQIVYYGFASLRAGHTSFCVPTGNFGNVFAGYLAKRMGFPIDKLLIATNENDILARFFRTGEYSRGEVRYTHAPAMDIQVASNFERFLYYHLQQDSQRVREFMSAFAATGRAALEGPPDADTLLATSVSDIETEAAIGAIYRESGYVADPHTAIGMAAAARFPQLAPMTCIGTASPAKFPEIVQRQVNGAMISHPRLDALAGQPSRRTVLPADVDAVRKFVAEHAV